MFDTFDIEIDKEEFFKDLVNVVALMMFDCKDRTTFNFGIEPNKIVRTWVETDFVYEKAEKAFYRLSRVYMAELVLIYPPRKYIYIAEALLEGNKKKAENLAKSFEVYGKLSNFLNSYVIDYDDFGYMSVPLYLEEFGKRGE